MENKIKVMLERQAGRLDAMIRLLENAPQDAKRQSVEILGEDNYPFRAGYLESVTRELVKGLKELKEELTK
jgi:hypothetical protein